MTQANFSDETQTIDEVVTVDLVVDEPGVMTTVTPETPTSQFQDIKDQVLTILSELPVYLSSFFTEYQKPLITVGLILAGGISIKVMLGVLAALNDVPLVTPVFELIGMGYTGWFVYRYLLKASTRQELLTEVDSFKEQVVGKDS
ncbi:CAAD domain-containing protein [Microcoleus sp. LEGE 07076]|uniref:CAAD domain-containing protein n=1 Tax=Microcoleus sp. LEGE 07076 TaxID=915322 RepID=UPI001880D89E|nr:CAAD domain-containing protein [Microcoleus sp. LEGE 07076]MBE9184272.1 CAAD domain-containing protein [Microcoleus sp. LEGE 07076]